MAVTLTLNNKKAVLKFSSDAQSLSSAEEDDILNQITESSCKTVYAETDDKNFSTVLMAELYAWHQKFQQAGLDFNFQHLPQSVQDLLTLALKSINTPPSNETTTVPMLERIGKFGYQNYLVFMKALDFIHQTFISFIRFISGKAIYRKKDFWFVFADCSYQAIGITALVSFLVGLILAFVGAIQLRAFGAGIYVASMVSIGMTRIMAAIMVGIIMAGRTGSSYAATLGTMQVNEEIDALKTLGIKITDYLVVPRLVALILTIPFLTLLADLLGIFGGAVVGIGFLDLSPSSYFDYSIKALNLTNILVGLLHSFIYGIIISICGCYEGLTAGRDADAVGKATTSAVVTSLVWMIVATGILTIILEVIGL